ncbi:LysM peptidoglycan-binding domain-containing protein [Alicyclobacillus kakegawensis]|uniref:LysM peptidoglycan-binding domain-containing protein n=1 Tax=Alicyclobacillus kakegawensis TaxID=392012 RepID=UPI000833EDEA|nr:LysM peptidoglycan-binding domain-containing protein [Alicyclobacillus kakegawensis]
MAWFDDNGNNKLPMMIAIGAGLGVLSLLVFRSSGGSSSSMDTSDTMYGMIVGGTMFIPTSETIIDYGTGNNYADSGSVTNTTTTTTTDSNNTVGSGTTVTVTPPATSEPPPQSDSGSGQGTQSPPPSTSNPKPPSTTTSKPPSTTTTKTTTTKTTTTYKYVPKVSTYTVKSGDNLWTIVSKEYGIPNSGQANYTKIANILAQVEKANPQIKNPNLIYPGQKINLPKIS